MSIGFVGYLEFVSLFEVNDLSGEDRITSDTDRISEIILYLCLDLVCSWYTKRIVKNLFIT